MFADPLQQVDRTCVRYRGRKLVYFGGCDYFRLASHPKVLHAVAQGLSRYGLNVAASRLTTGNHALYEELETALAKFFNAPRAVLTPNGYSPNLMIAQALAGRFSHVLIDEKAHGCLADAALLFNCPTVKFRHRDPDDVRCALKRLGHGAQPVLLTDGLFAHDGGIAPLKEYLRILPRDSIVVVDDAHGAGVLGRNGGGTPEHARVRFSRLIQTVTLSKAFGVFGGAILCSESIAKHIVSHSRMFIGSTPLPLPLAHAALTSLKLMRTDKAMRRRLARNVRFAKSALRKAGYPILDTPAPVISILPASRREAAKLSDRMLAAEIHPPQIRYLNGPKDGYFRIALSSEHTQRQLETLVQVLAIHAQQKSVSRKNSKDNHE